MITVTIDIPLKKGVTATTRWNLTQDIPYPDITAECGRLAWRNSGGLFKQFGQPAKGLENCYSLYMDSGNPVGTSFFTFRGLTLGEIKANITISQWSSFSWKVRINETPKDSEQSLLDLYVKPVIIQAIEDHKDELKADAVKRLKEHVTHQFHEALDRLEKLNKEMELAIDNL